LAPGELWSEVEGDLEKVERTIRITEVRVKYHLPLKREEEETAERVMQVHPAGCPAHQSVKDCIRIVIDREYEYRD